MTTILGAAVSGIEHYTRMMDAIGHNLANVNTDGFKVVRPMSQGDPNAVVEGANRRLGVADTTLDRVFLSGAAKPTNYPLHFAIQDESFISVRTPNGALAFTRQGGLWLDSARNLVTPAGHLLEPPVQIPEDAIAPSIDANGVVGVMDTDGQRIEIARIPFYKFVNPRGLESIGDGLYVQTVNSGAAFAGTPGEDGFASLIPGAVESSNVDLPTEFANMVIAQRAYQASARSFSIGDQMLELATNISR